jgi:hypothetical protein
MKATRSLRSALPIIGLLALVFENARADTYSVNTSSDNVVASACANHAANCSLRSAILTANAHSGDTIVFSINEFCSVSGCVINLLSVLPDISAPMSIGPSGFAIQRSSSASTNFRIFNVTTSGTVNFSGLTIKGGLVSGPGAGIQNLNSGTVNVINCVVRDNTASGNGGGISNNASGTINLTNSSFLNNRAQSGGGLAGGGSITVSGSTFSGNTVVGGTGAHTGDRGLEGRGGAIYGLSPGTLDVSDSTFTGNSATGGLPGGDGSAGGGNGAGGAIYNSTNSLKLASCTMVGNSTHGGTAPPAGQGFAGGVETITAATIRSSIIALNTANVDPDVLGSFTSGGFNLIGKTDGSTAFTAASDQTGTVAAPLDPKLDLNGLQNNGGPTSTIALAPGSPAIDKGTSMGLSVNLTSDQRGTGFPRVFDDSAIGNAAGGDGTDIGAFELQSGQPTKLANISTRLAVQTGDNVLIGGFIITGTEPKKVILRAMGPSLNLPGQLANPTLELYTGSALLASNDDWQNQPAADKQAVIDSTIPPPSDLESALVRTLAANGTAYTAVVRGANNGTGIGVIEAYDLNGIADSKLANISTRGFVETGDNVLIAGTIILGNTPQKIIVRAIGPSLSVPGKMADPTLELRNQNGGLIETNDDWMDSPNKQAIIDSTVPPSDDKESAIVQTLPGNGASYTAILRGVNNTTGIAVVEVYALQ